MLFLQVPTSSTIRSTRLFWCELQSAGYTDVGDACLLYNIIKLDGIQLVVLKTFKKYN